MYQLNRLSQNVYFEIRDKQFKEEDKDDLMNQI